MGHNRVLVVEDELHSRNQMEAWLNEIEEVGEVRTARGLADAKAVLKEFTPSVMFLDIELGDGNSFDLINADTQAKVIFTTAYDLYAVKAFRVNAIDYIMKPFDKADIVDALDRISVGDRADHSALEVKKILRVKHNGRVHFVEASDISLISSEDYYSALHVGGREFLTRKSIRELTEELQPHGFLRIHRSTIVNLNFVISSKRLVSGGLEIGLSDGRSTTVSRNQIAAFNAAMEAKPHRVS
ncbi:LytR/AlgR family response regulator transcription factor [Maricaulis sp. MIT060901]|uniref:LytR/AlgR family response regulator transcription factor n=1 Tax=Maricaulis sp. MIT060901 TaxID=3096993 RepID=UPI00399A8A83